MAFKFTLSTALKRTYTYITKEQIAILIHKFSEHLVFEKNSIFFLFFENYSMM